MITADRIELMKGPDPEWVREMREHYREKGWYRPDDLKRLLGDPNRRVDMGTKESIERLMTKR